MLRSSPARPASPRSTIYTVWEVTSGFPALSAHVLVPEGDDCHARRGELERLLDDRFGIHHTTLQVDHDQPAPLLEIQ
jgi:cobalt-zinc-cadmium efflux system protein